VSLVTQEQLVRNAAVLGLHERAGAYRLVPLTLRRWTALVVMQSPYLPPFKTPTAGDTLALLWVLSPDYVPGNSPEALARRQQFMKGKFPFVPPLPPLLWRTRRALGKHEVAKARAQAAHAEIVCELRDYISETLQDAPRAVPGHHAVAPPEFYCDAIAIAADLARAYGGGLEGYFDLALKLVFQAMKELSAHHALANGKPVLLENPSDAEADAELVRLNAELVARGERLHPDTVAYLERMKN